MNDVATVKLEIRKGRGRSLGRHGTTRGPEIVGYATVLDDDFTRSVLMPLAWHLSACARCYPRTRVRRPDGTIERPMLHVLVYQHYHGLRAGGLHVDHEDGNVLNALPTNLRAVPPSVNGANRTINRNNTSGFRGVSWDKARRAWDARIKVNRKVIHLGRFSDACEAAEAVNVAYERYFPDVALPNPTVRDPAEPNVLAAVYRR